MVDCRIDLGAGRLSLALLLAGLTGAQASPPEWLAADASLAAPGVVDKGAEVLRDEVIVTIDAQGGWQELRRMAIRVHTQSGAVAVQAAIRVPYVEKADAVLQADAWLVRAGHEATRYNRRDWHDRAEIDGVTLYTDFRQLVLAQPQEGLIPGDVLGAEVRLKRTGNVGQGRYEFGHGLPIRRARIEYRVPAGWEPHLHWLSGNGPAAQVAADRKTWSWERLELPAGEDEPWACDAPLLQAAVSLRPAAGMRSTGLVVLDSWRDTAVWLNQLQQSQCDTGPALKATVQALVEKLDEPAQKIAVIARFVQERRYIAVNRNDGLGFGYRPRRATEVLAADYGDCKDKVNLMQAMLREAGIRAHFVAVFAGDPEAVQPEWPSPLQFNHAIIAIEPPSGGGLATGGPGRPPLIFFDPTARWTPLGELPWILQGSRGLVCEPDTTALITLPRAAPDEAWGLAAQATLVLEKDGSMTGELVTTFRGEPAATARSAGFEQAESHQRNRWAQKLSPLIPGVAVGRVSDDSMAGERGCTTRLQISAPRFGQKLNWEMLMLKLDLWGGDDWPAFSNNVRLRPLQLPPLQADYQTSIDLPPGSIPELPAGYERESRFGRFTARYEANGSRVVYRRSLRLNGLRVEPASYPEFRQFVQEVTKAERTGMLVKLRETGG